MEPDDASWAELAQRCKQDIEVLDAPPVDLAPGEVQAKAVTGSSACFLTQTSLTEEFSVEA